MSTPSAGFHFHSKSPKVLVVSAEPGQADIVCRLLKEAGEPTAEILRAASVAEAKTLLRTTRVDAAVVAETGSGLGLEYPYVPVLRVSQGRLLKEEGEGIADDVGFTD